MRRAAQWAAALGAAALLLAVGCLQLAGDRWWPTVMLLYGPRYLLGGALVLVIPLALVDWRRGLPALLGCSLLLGFGILDLRTGLRRGPAPVDPIHLISFNMANHRSDHAAVASWIATQAADLVMLVECVPERGADIARAAGLTMRSTGSLCLLSRWPVTAWAARPQHEFWRRYGSGAIVRAEVAIAGDTLVVGLVHLATPRHAMDTFGDLSELPTRGGLVNENRELRRAESRAAREWIGGPDAAAIVAGDFNLPVESAVYREAWGDFGNAFSDAGRGLGWTKRTRWFGVRIDHVLTGRDIRAVNARLGPSFGSDHRPLVTTLVRSAYD